MVCSRTVGVLMLALVTIAAAPREAVPQTSSGAKLGRFSDKRLETGPVTAETANGPVALRGKVDSGDGTAATISVAKGIGSLKTARSDLQVVPAERRAVEATDETITRRIEERLARDGRLSKVGVRTDRGVVILTGEVPSLAAAACASEIARGVPGVRSLRSEVISDPARRKRDRLLFALMLFAAMGRHGTVAAVRERTGEASGRLGEAADAGQKAQEDRNHAVTPRSESTPPPTTQMAKGRIACLAASARQLTLEDGTVLTLPEDSHVQGPLKVGTIVRARYVEEHGQKLVRSITVRSSR